MNLPNLKLVVKLTFSLIASWIAIHVFAIFGVFLSAFYPIWWLFNPKKTSCFFCRMRLSKRCPFCKRVISEMIHQKHPATFVSALANGALLFILSLFCFGLVSLESMVLFKLGFPPTPKTASFVIPPKGRHYLGEIFPMQIEIIGIDKPINAVQADIGFDPDKLEVVEISTKESFANIFIQEEVNNDVGYVRLTGGLPNPGFFADRGLFGTLYFKGKNPGVVKIEFLPSSLVLANDGQGTNVLKDLASASYLILPERIDEIDQQLQEEYLKSQQVDAAETQLKFDDESRILGVRTEEEIELNKNRDYVDKFATLLEESDRFILSFWSKMLNLTDK